MDTELERLLQLCKECQTDDQGTFASSWIRELSVRNGIKYHASRMRTLVRLGYLELHDITRAGGRRYYCLTALGFAA